MFEQFIHAFKLGKMQRFGEAFDIAISSTGFSRSLLVEIRFVLYSLIFARTQYGLMVQIVSGLITYLLLAVYCYKEHGEKVNIGRVRELRTNILNEALASKPQRSRRKRKTRKKKRKRPNAKT